MVGGGMKYYMGDIMIEVGKIEVMEKVIFKLEDDVDADAFLEEMAKNYGGKRNKFTEVTNFGAWNTYWYDVGEGVEIGCWTGCAQEITEEVYEYLTADRPDGSIFYVEE
jgi:hypothetical protein